MRARAREKFRKGQSIGWYVIKTHHGAEKAVKVGDGEQGEVEAKAIAAQLNAEYLESERRADTWTQPAIRFPLDETCRAWIEVYKGQLAKSTEQTHRHSIENQLVPFFGSRDIKSITEPDLIAFIDERFEAGKSAATIKNALSSLRRVCSLLVTDGRLDRNPATNIGRLVSQGAKRHGKLPSERDSFTREEAATLLDAAHRFEPVIYPVLVAALSTGMRRGELLALQWRDVESDSLHVRRALVGDEIGSTKSGKARRVPIGPDLRSTLTDLRRSRLKREGPWTDAALVFTTATGQRWDVHNFGRAWRRLHRKIEKEVEAKRMNAVRPLAFHCCRHTFASWALAGTETASPRPIVWVAEMLGHSSVEVTLRNYAHFMPRETEDMGFLGSLSEDRSKAGADLSKVRGEVA